jgi:hypothetical protein
MRILFLDDNEERHRNFVMANIGHRVDQVYKAAHAIRAMEMSDPYDVASLDHDLDEQSTMGLTPTELTGLDVVRAMVNPEGALKDKLPRTVIVHSYNNAGATNMVSLLRAWAPSIRVVRFPFRPDMPITALL